MPVGSVTNERAHWHMDYLRGDLRTTMTESHLNACAVVYSSPYTEQSFPYAAALAKYKAAKQRRG